MDIFGALNNWIVTGLGLPEWVYLAVAAVLKALVFLLFILLNALFLIWLERKVSGHIQQRLGPMRHGWHGLAQTLWDVLKLIAKEDVVPAGADRRVFALAPIVAFAPALAIFLVIPWGPNLIANDLNIGLIFISAVTGFIVISFIMAGWSSNNKWSLIGAVRTAAQLVSYEIPLVLSIAAVALLAGSLSLQDIVHAQRDGVWFILLQPLGFIVYLVATIAELNRAPFDLAEAESELVAGYQTEYSGMRWAMFFLAEYANLVSASAIMSTLYFGGWDGPAFLPPVVWILLKTYFFIFVAMWIRWSFPRVRVDHLMDLGWKGLVPLSLVNLVITGIYVLVR